MGFQTLLDQVTMDDVRQAAKGRVSIGRIVQAVWDVDGMLILNHSYKTSPKNFADTNDWGLLYIYIYI